MLRKSGKSLWKNEYLYIEKKMRHEWEKVETFMSMELNCMESGGQGCERKCVKGGRRYLRKQSGPAHRANASMQMQMGGKASMYVEINRCFGELED